MPDEPFTRRWLNNFDCQIRTTNNTSVRESITKKKLGFEVAKLVRGCAQTIRVGTAFTFIGWFRYSLG